MRRLVNYFLRGLAVTAPLAFTLYICWAVFRRIDGWLQLPIPGAGFVITVAAITLVGAAASNLVTRSVVSLVETTMGRLPFVRLLYTSSKDLLNAFVGEKRRFDKPVVVTLYPGSQAKALGFVTRESLEQLGLADHVAVYIPQSYNFAGSLLLFPADQVRPIPAESSAVMAFIVSGGVSASERDAAGHLHS
ncbi:MAG TPA: DUF502 domain-containing protein [Gemmatimonadaceae bacterium]|nr:DUF502 domain-containing protein [Gemmatimonadaceae bacterium]